MTGRPSRSLLLSHRLRGFDRHENTLAGLTAALAAGVLHVEFDARDTRDGVLVAVHDPVFKADDGSWQRVRDWEFEALRGQGTMRHICRVVDLVGAFAAAAGPEARLHVDIKVDGRVRELKHILETAGALERTILVSWLASALIEFHALSPTTRLCFSHVSFARAPWLYSVAKALLRPGLLGLVPLTGLASDRSRRLGGLSLHFHDDGAAAADLPAADQAGRTQAHLVPGFLTGDVLDLLRNTRGLVCVPLWCVSRRFVERYHRLGVGVAVFSVRSRAALDKLLTESGPDIIYVDDASLIVGA
jgi:glycerophosphoryl diester phosphodiesterase